MAYETATVVDHDAFWTALIDFLTTNTDLVMAGEEWTSVWSQSGVGDFDEEVVLQGPGLAGTDEIYVGLQLKTDVPNDIFEIRISGMSGIVDGVTDMRDHINVSEDVTLFLTNDEMEYWISGSGRRFALTVKISTVYCSAYAGLFLPFAQPTRYPYPLFIGGCAPGASREQVASFSDWRSTSILNNNYLHAHYQDFNPEVFSAGWVLTPEGSWVQVCNQVSGTDRSSNWAYIHPYGDPGNAQEGPTSDQTYRPWVVLGRTNPAFGGDEVLIPCTIGTITPVEQLYGVLDGIFAVGGNSNISEDVITVGSDDHMVYQNNFRTGGDQYHAMKLG